MGASDTDQTTKHPCSQGAVHIWIPAFEDVKESDFTDFAGPD
jgi:hypothetical protein